MGALTDKDFLYAVFDKGVFTARDVRRLIRDAPEVKAYPERKAVLQRDIVHGKVVHMCTGCAHALPLGMLPNAVKCCSNCGARFTGIIDKPGIENR